MSFVFCKGQRPRRKCNNCSGLWCGVSRFLKGVTYVLLAFLFVSVTDVMESSVEYRCRAVCEPQNPCTMTTTMFASVVVLLAFLLSTVLVVDGQCRIGCSNSDVLGYMTLEDLNCAIQEEMDAIQAGLPLRMPPYRYTLCPNTAFTVTNQTTIRPQLDNTIIQCGLNGIASDSCTIMSSNMWNDVVLNFSSSASVQVSFQGLTFVANDASHENFTASVVAPSPSGNLAMFTDCHWSGRSLAVDNSLGDVVPRLDLMEVRLTNCSITASLHNSTCFVTHTHTHTQRLTLLSLFRISTTWANRLSPSVCEQPEVVLSLTTPRFVGLMYRYGGLFTRLVVWVVAVLSHRVSHLFLPSQRIVDARDGATVRITNSHIRENILKDPRQFRVRERHTKQNKKLMALWVFANNNDNDC